MEADTTEGWSAAQYKYEIDKGMAQVMPDYWDGHARVTIWESDVPDNIAEKATQKAITLANENEVTPETAAKSLINNIKDKMD